MARIPLGNFGNAIPSAAPRVNIPEGAFDSGGRSMQQAGNQLMGMASQAMDEQRQQDEALRRAKAANAVLDREIAVKGVSQSLEEDIAAGKVHYTAAPQEYKKRLSELATPDIKDMDPVTAENFQRGIKRADMSGESAIYGAIKNARTADFRTQTEGLLDKLGKQAGMPGANVEALNAQADAIEEVGRQAYGAGWEKRKQDWKDSNWNDQLNQQAMAVRDDLKAINALQKEVSSGVYADKLDSNRRNTLVARLDAYKTSLIQRQEAAAARAERAQERQMKRAEAEFKTFSELADKGTIIAPEYIDRAIQATAGTPYQQGVVAMAKQAKEVGGFAAQPIARQQATLDQIDALIATKGRTPELDKRREQLSKVLSGSKQDLKENGLRAGLERGVITEMAPLDVRSPDAFAASIKERLAQSEAVSQWAGKPVSPLDAKEAETVRNMLDALPPKQRSTAVATIAGAVGPRVSSAIAEQIGAQDKPLALAFAASGMQTTADRYTSELILKGAGAIKDGAVMKDDKKVTGWKATIANQVDGAFSDENTAAKVKDSAYYIAAAMAQENGGSIGTSDIRRAVSLAMGGDIIERNGKKLPVPAGVSDDDLDKRLRSVTAEEITKQAPDGKVRAGGAELSAAEFAKTIAGQELIYAGPGRYAVVVRGRPVVNSAGRPIIIGVR